MNKNPTSDIVVAKERLERLRIEHLILRKLR